MNNSNSDTSSSSYFDSSFDYRSLLPIHSSSAAAEEPKESCCSFLPELSWRERCIGCATCMIAGYLLSMGSFWRIKDLMTGNPMPFVVNATVGNMIALAGSFFFTGPTQQIKDVSRKTAHRDWNVHRVTGADFDSRIFARSRQGISATDSHGGTVYCGRVVLLVLHSLCARSCVWLPTTLLAAEYR